MHHSWRRHGSAARNLELASEFCFSKDENTYLTGMSLILFDEKYAEASYLPIDITQLALDFWQNHLRQTLLCLPRFHLTNPNPVSIQMCSC